MGGNRPFLFPVNLQVALTVGTVKIGADVKRAAVYFALVLPALALLFWYAFPQADPIFNAPLFHFYIVTFTTFAATVVSIFVTISVGQTALPRHLLLAIAFAWMGAVFFIHGVTTPNALITHFHPAIQTSAWLTLWGGGVLFLAGAFTPDVPNLSFLRIIGAIILTAYLSYAAVVLFFPELLTQLLGRRSPPLETLVFGLTLIIWLTSAVRHYLNYRQARNFFDGLMAFESVWYATATVSMFHFAVWNASWWLYHALLLLGFLIAIYALWRAYEQIRTFRLSRYFAAASLIVTAALALFSAQLYSQQVYGLVTGQGTPELAELLTLARRSGIGLAALSMGGLFLALLFIVRRAEQIITSRTRELERAYADLRQAESLRDDLTSMIVHDLRNPLTAITTNLDMINKTSQNPEVQPRFLNNARTAGQRMMGMIDDLLNVSKFEAGELRPVLGPTELPALIGEREPGYRSQANKEGKTLTLHAAADLPPVIADAGLIGRVLDNLISNAFKYTETGGHIEIQVERQDSALTVHVRDDGQGIPAEYHQRIFEKFVQVTDSGGKSLRKGTGLGLAFCRLAVEAHRGKIWVKSAPGQGSTFSFTLPLSAPER